ncbi:MAG: histidine kinase [Candidatus Promineifilaceae bacterium]
MSKRYASHQRWAVGVLWLSIAFAALVIFARGIPNFVGDLRETYGARLGFSLQLGRADELILIPEEGGQAALAGMMERDVLVAVDGRPVGVDDADALVSFFSAGAAGSPITLQIRTGERPPREIALVRGDRPGAWLNRSNMPIAAVVAVAVGIELLVTLGFIAVAAFIFWRGGRAPIIWLSSLVLILVFAGAGSLPVQSLYFFELDWQYALDIWFSLMIAALLLFFVLFPSGHFVPRWAVFLLPLCLGWVIAAWLLPDLYFWRLDSRTYLLVLLLLLFAGVAAQLWRYRFVSSPNQRQQTKWVVWGMFVALTALFVQIAAGQIVPNSPLLFDLLINPLTRLAQLFIPVTVALAVFQRRLWEIDALVNRTLVYGGLTLSVVAVYALVVGALGALFHSQGNFVLAILATGLIAVLFQPVRERLQRSANRLMFGERDDPYAVLSKLGVQLQTTTTPEAMLQSVVGTIATALKLPYVAIELAGKDGRLSGAAVGTAVAQTAEFPLRYQNETVGYLVVSPRSPGEIFTERERQLLSDISGQTGAMAYAVRLTAALQRSRETLVLAREEERRRIRSDLHDELGPTLASQTFALDAALDALEHDPQTAADLLRTLKIQNQATVAEIRRLVYELRPPTLDELGILGALQAHVAKLDGRSAPTIQISSDPDPLPALSAAVEVAAFRITLEAITNVVRHARARRCEVLLKVVGTALHIEVSDDGIGMPAKPRPGVGLHSMRERAEELGGSLLVVNDLPGARVTAVLPL